MLIYFETHARNFENFIEVFRYLIIPEPIQHFIPQPIDYSDYILKHTLTHT